MKKIIRILSLVLVFTMLSATAVFASDNQETITYDGINFEKSELSSDTVEWLEWYNGLPDELKGMVSNEPSELAVGVATSSSTIVQDARELDKVFPVPHLKLLLPTSGYEPTYNPTYWNKAENIRRANCYAYSMDVICNREMKLQPGQLAGKTFTSLTENAIFQAAQSDAPYLGSGRTIARASQNDKPGRKQYKVALVIAPNTDYHWYVQNTDGYWSHKPGYSSATNVDASGRKITDPQSCNRNYGALNYSTFCGYYIVTR